MKCVISGLWLVLLSAFDCSISSLISSLKCLKKFLAYSFLQYFDTGIMEGEGTA